MHTTIGVSYYLLLRNYIFVVVCYSETDITSLLTAILPVLAGQIEELTLSFVSINSGCVEVLIHSLTSPHSHLLKLQLTSCIISSSDYCHLTTAIPTSNLTHFTTNCTSMYVSSAKGLVTAIPTSNLTHFTTKSLGIDVSSAKGLARAMAQSKTLEEVEVMLEYSMNNEVA